jgi:hypothetical protein
LFPHNITAAVGYHQTCWERLSGDSYSFKMAAQAQGRFAWMLDNERFADISSCWPLQVGCSAFSLTDLIS